MHVYIFVRLESNRTGLLLVGLTHPDNAVRKPHFFACKRRHGSVELLAAWALALSGSDGTTEAAATAERAAATSSSAVMN